MGATKRPRRPYRDRAFARAEAELMGAPPQRPAGLDFEKARGGFRVFKKPAGPRAVNDKDDEAGAARAGGPGQQKQEVDMTNKNWPFSEACGGGPEDA